MAEIAPPGLLRSLRQDAEVGRLVRAIGLSDRFRFYLLVCPTPRVAQAVFAILEQDVEAERDEPAPLTRLDPYQAHPDLRREIMARLGPLAEGKDGEQALVHETSDLLLHQVLDPLVAPSPAIASRQALVVIDASRAPPHDDDAWSVVFQRMNERRNLIAGKLAGALLLALPPRLEPIFAHAAPDFWSIRSLAALVQAPEDARPLGLEALAAEPLREVAPAAEVGEAEEIERELTAARARVDAAPDDVTAIDALLVWLERRVEHELARGTLGAALPAVKDLEDWARRRLVRDPERAEWQLYLSLSLSLVGVVHEALGEPDLALRSYEESLELRRRLLERDPERADWRRVLSLSLNRVGDVHRERGERDLALRSYEESLGLMRRVVERDPERAEWLRDLSVSLHKVGDVRRARGELDLALRSDSTATGPASGATVRLQVVRIDADRILMTLSDAAGVVLIGPLEARRAPAQPLLSEPGC